MALSASMVWEVRTTGISTNGAGYASLSTAGTVDYSQQDTAQLAGNNLYCTTTTSTITSVGASFGTDLVNNLVYISGGTNFTAGYYQIISASVTGGTACTLDRTPAASAATSSLGSFGVGGAADHPNTISASITSGHTAYIASGTYTPVGANTYVLNTKTSGGNGLPVKWIGYKTTRTTVPYGSDRPVFDSETDTSNVIDIDQPNNLFQNLIFKRDNSFTLLIAASANPYFHNCRFTTGVAGVDVTTTVYLHFTYCEMDNYASPFMNESGNGSVHIFHSYLHDNGGGLYTNHNAAQLIGYGSIFESNSGSGFGGGVRCFFVNCIAYNNTGAASDGFTFCGADNGNGIIAYNNISVNNGRCGFMRAGTGRGFTQFFDYNCYVGNGSAGLNNLTAGIYDITSDPLFTDPTANPPDFTLQSSSPCKDAGFPDANWATNIGLASGRY